MLPIPGLGLLDYLCPQELQLAPGDFVQVPLGRRSVSGIVWSDGEGRLPLSKLKPVAARLDLPGIGPGMLRFLQQMAAYTLTNPAALVRMVLASPAALEGAPTRTMLSRAPHWPDALKMTPARKRVWDAAEEGQLYSVRTLAEEAGVSEAVVRAVVAPGAFTQIKQSVDEPFPMPQLDKTSPKLSAEQAAAAEGIIDALGGFTSFLLDGVTGSGKTEVYFEVLCTLLAEADAQVLVLLPEIALTSQWLERFEDRFGVAPVVWHSDIGEAGRRRAWRAVATGEARVVVGARSALLLPFQKLGLIVVDEEHDQSYKQEEGVLYHARDMAVLRAREAACPVVLASATPSLESRMNAAAGRYRLLELKERHGTATLPSVTAIDMRRDAPPAGRWISPALEEAITECLGRGEQAILFLNRRGYAPLTLCRTCGYRFQCPNCTTWLVEHRFQSHMECHHCGHYQPVPRTCPQCKNEDTLVPCGPGVERLFEEVSALFPAARVAVLTSDTVQKPDDMARLVASIAAGAIDLIIGTQIITKGYHFDRLTLVGVIDADLGLRGGDLRAAERTYQQMVQVAGRAGRAERPGHVFLQTYEPAHPVVHALVAGDAAGFLALEEETRERLYMPPFGGLVALILSGEKEAEVMAVGQKLARAAPSGEGVSVFGPAPAPLSRIRGKFRIRLLLHAHNKRGMQKWVQAWLSRVSMPRNIRLKVDVDPYNFL